MTKAQFIKLLTYFLDIDQGATEPEELGDNYEDSDYREGGRFIQCQDGGFISLYPDEIKYAYDPDWFEEFEVWRLIENESSPVAQNYIKAVKEKRGEEYLKSLSTEAYRKLLNLVLFNWEERGIVTQIYDNTISGILECFNEMYGDDLEITLPDLKNNPALNNNYSEEELKELAFSLLKNNELEDLDPTDYIE